MKKSLLILAKGTQFRAYRAVCITCKKYVGNKTFNENDATKDTEIHFKSNANHIVDIEIEVRTLSKTN